MIRPRISERPRIKWEVVSISTAAWIQAEQAKMLLSDIQIRDKRLKAAITDAVLTASHPMKGENHDTAATANGTANIRNGA